MRRKFTVFFLVVVKYIKTHTHTYVVDFFMRQLNFIYEFVTGFKKNIKNERFDS